MLRWPEPALVNEIRYSGIAVNKMVTENLYTEAQLKQDVRDALNLAADTCESTLYVNGDGTVSVFGPKTDANVEIRKCRDAIRALIKEVV